MSYKAKRIVIAVAAAVTLFAAASIGTYFFIKGNESAEATENKDQVVDQNIDSNNDTGSNNPESTSNDQNNGQTTGNQNRTVDNAGTPATNNGTTTTRTTTNEDGTTTRTTTNADGTTTTIRMNTDGTTTTTITNPDGTIASQTTDANVITEIEESERLVSKDDWVGWTPEAVPVPVVARIANDLSINKYKLNIVKEVISTDADEDGKYDNGETITYKITVSNVGNTKLEGIKVSDKINAREDINKMSHVDENNTLIQEIENISEFTFDLEAGEKTYFEYSYTVKEEDILAGVVENGATAKNNKVEEKTTITTETEKVNEDYTVTKVADKKTVKAGDVVTYTITVTNTGNVTLKDLTVKDEMIDLDTTVTLAVGETKTFTGTYTVTQDDIDAQKVITNTVTVGDVPTTEEITPEPENKDYTVTKVADKKTVKAGDVVTYTITVTNTGNVTLKDLTVKDEMIDLDTTVTLAVGETKTFTGTYTVTQDDIDAQKVITNTVYVGDVPTTEEITPEPENPVLTVKKTADKANNVKAGETVNYTITIKNEGNVTIKDITVTDTLKKLDKDGNELSTMGLDVYEDKEYTTKVTNIEELAVKETKTLYAKYEVTQADVDNQVKLSNIATAKDEPSDPAETEVEKENPIITVEKTADKANNVKAGETVNYTITIKNEGNVTIKDIAVTDTLKKLDKDGNEISTMGLDVYEDKEYTTKVTNIEELAVKETKTLYAKYEVTQADVDNQVKLSNIATANNKPSDPAETEVEEATPGYNIEKTATLEDTGKEKAEVGDSIKYIITVENTGNVTLHDIVITDTTMNKSTTVETLNVNSGKVVALEFTHIVEESDFKEVDGVFVIQNIVNAECIDPTDDTKKLTDEAEAKVPVKDKYSYVVNYLEKDTNNVLANQKVVSDQTFGDTVTENAIDIDGYEKVDPTSAEIEITTGTNEHTFYYTKREDLSYTVYYKEQGTEETLSDPKVVENQTFGDKVTENAIDIDGYEKVDPTSAEIEITTGTNEHTFYYTKRNDLSYTVNYLEKETNAVLKDAKTVSNKTFGDVVNSADEVIETINKDNQDYDYDSADKDTLIIGTSANIINLYYVKAKDLEVTKTAPETANVTDTITYTITITNPNSKAKKTTVIDTLPDGITIPNVDETTGKLPDGKGVLTEEQIENEDGTAETIRKITWTDLEVATGDTQITFNAIVDSDMIGKEITNTASLSNYGSNQDDVTTKINEIKADKAEVKPGEQGKDSVNIVLVMDLSYSMKDADTDDNKTRLAVAKEAMTTFINKIYYNAEEQKPTNSKATVSVITFNTPEPMGNWSYWTQSYSNNIVANSGVNVLGSANKDNYSQLVTKINNLSLPNENPRRDNYKGMGTYMYGGLEQAETTLANTSAADKKNVVIFLSDGDPTYLNENGNVVKGYELNTNNNIIDKANDIKYDDEGNLVTDFYSIGFGKDASNTESVAYSLLSQMSSEGKVYTSNSVNGLVSNFVNILDDIGIKEIESQHGSITMNPTNGLLVSEEYPITVTYHDTEIINITNINDLEEYSFSYDEATKTLTWDVNAWNASVTDENGRTEVTESKNAVITYYTPRTTAKKLMRTSLSIPIIAEVKEDNTVKEDEEIELDKESNEEKENLVDVDIDENNKKQKEEPIVDDNEEDLQVVEKEETNKEKDKDIIDEEEKDTTVDENNIEDTEISSDDSQLNEDSALNEDGSLNIESDLQDNNQNNTITLE